MLVLGRVKNPRSSSKSQGAVGETEIQILGFLFSWVNFLNRIISAYGLIGGLGPGGLGFESGYP